MRESEPIVIIQQGSVQLTKKQAAYQNDLSIIQSESNFAGRTQSPSKSHRGATHRKLSSSESSKRSSHVVWRTSKIVSRGMATPSMLGQVNLHQL